jgi:hypothetical protein
MVRFPVLTDLNQFIGAYKLLFESIGIISHIDLDYCEDFSHPIPEENQKLTDDYMGTMPLLQQMFRDHGNSLVNTGVTVNQQVAIFIFSYEG